MTSQPLVSVVIPFHNTGRFLREAVESVLAQTYADFELILQDNASDDGATEIALEMARHDSRIAYYRQDALLSQVANYNLALTRISPRSAYCKMVQADDLLFGDCLRQMVEVAERAPAVGLVSSFSLEDTAVRGAGLPYTTTVVDGRELARFHLLGQNFLFGSPTTVMYRSAVVRERAPSFFTEGRLHEDTEACYEILRKWDFAFVHQILSYSRVREDSIYAGMRPFDTGILDKLIVLRRYGPDFLTPAEFESRWREVESRYYRCLGRAVLEARGSAYWSLHRHGLGTIGGKIQIARLARAVGHEALTMLLCPLQIVDLARQLRNRRSA